MKLFSSYWVRHDIGGICSLLLMLFFLIVSCQDRHTEWTNRIVPETREFECQAGCSLYRLDIESGTSWIASSSADWLFIKNTYGSGRDSLLFSVQENAETYSREAQILLTDSNHPDQQAVVIRVIQNGTDDNNSFLISDFEQNLAVGWGYHAFGEYAAKADLRAQVIDANQLIFLGEQMQEAFCNTESSYRLHYDQVTAHSQEEYSKTMTETSSSKTNLLFYKKETTKRFTKITTTQVDQTYATMSLINTVAQKYISEGSLKALLEEGYEEILTECFRNEVKKVEQNPTSEQAQALIQRFGTSVVLRADIGGRLDFSMTLKKTKTTNIETTLTSTYKKLFGKSSSMTQEETQVYESIKKDFQCDYQIKGGDSKALKVAMDQSIVKKEPIDNKYIAAWESGFKNLSADSLLRTDLVDLVDFYIIPITDCIRNQTAKACVEQALIELGAAPANSFQTAEYQNIRVTIDEEQLVNNVHAVIYQNQPVLEITREYIPSIRTDRPVTVIYPITEDGTADWLNGFFIGDGEGHAPGRIYWNRSENTCSYQADPAYRTDQVITEIYFYKNNIYAELKTYMPQPVDGAFLTPIILNSVSSGSVTKIGTAYWIWTRGSNITSFNLSGQWLQDVVWRIDESGAFTELIHYLSGSSKHLFLGGGTGLDLLQGDYVRRPLSGGCLMITSDGFLKYDPESTGKAKGDYFIFSSDLHYQR